jgi:thiol-disulfide isomerase/thioredoxin
MNSRSLLTLCLFFTWTAAAAPSNDSFSSPRVIASAPASITTATGGATAQPGEPFHDGYPPRASVWFRWTAPSAGIVDISTLGSGFDTILAVYTGTSLSSLVRVASNDDANGSTSRVGFFAFANTIYYIAVDGYEGDVGYLKLGLTFTGGVAAPPNDNRADAILITNIPVSISAINYLATIEPGEFTPIASGGASVWWQWVAPTDGNYIVTTEGSDFDTILTLSRDSTVLDWNDDASSSTSELRFNAHANIRYYFSVQGYDGAIGRVQLNVAANPPRPSPQWRLAEMNGLSLQASDFLGKVVILDFWATWCGPCIEEIPMFIRLQDRFGPDGLVIIGVSTDAEGFAVVRPFAESYQVNYLETITNYAIERDFGPIEFIPSTFIISREGMITDEFVGSYPQKTFEDAILPLLYPPIPLNAGRAGTNIVMNWAGSIAGYLLQSSTNLTSTNWLNVASTIEVSGQTNSVRLPISGENRFFRLVHP